MSTAFERVLSEVFDFGAEVRMSPEEEATAIERAKWGVEASVIALVLAYSPALRNGVRKYRDALGVEDARSLAVEGLLRAVKEHDPSKGARLAGLVSATIARTLSAAAMTESDWSVPERTLSRWYSIIRDADGDVEAALASAQAKGMSREVFLDVLSALRNTASLDDKIQGANEHPSKQSQDLDAHSLWGDADAFAAAEDRLMAEIALDAVEGLEDVVTRLAYGFATGEPLSDGGIVHALAEETLGAEAALAGQTTVSRATVQRTRSSALATMRSALGVA